MKNIIFTALVLVALLGCGWVVADSDVMLAALAPTGQTITHDSLAMFGMAGLLVNKESVSAAFTSLKTIYQNALETTESQWEITAMKVTSNTSENSYKWLSRFVKMRKWVGDKVFKALKASSYTIVNDDWEATVEVKRNDIEDESLGLVAPQAQDAGYSAKLLPEEIIDELKNKAFAAKCYDGKAFYSDQHKVGKTTFSNKGTAPLSNATKADADACVGAGRLALASIRDEEGRPLKIKGRVLEVCPTLETTANSLANDKDLADGTPNPYRGMFTVLVNYGLESSTQWMLHDVSRPIKPFIYQERKAPVFVSQTSMDSEEVFTRGVFLFGVEARAAGGYGLWQMSYGSTGAG